MIRNYLLTALRAMWRYKGYSLINIAGLSIGMACSILIFLWVAYELSYDRYHAKADRIYRLVQTQHYNSGPLTTTCMPGIISRDLLAQYPEVEDGFMFYRLPGVVVNYGEKNFIEDVRMADPGLFRMFDFSFVSGDPQAALNDVSSIVITRKMAEKYFPGEEPMGKVLRINDAHDFKVTAVIEEVNLNSTFRFDFCIPFEFLDVIGNNPYRYGWNSYYSYILLKEGTDVEAFGQKIFKHIQEQGDPEDDDNIDLWLHPLTKVHLHDIRGGGLIEQVYILSAVAVFILFIACINFMNLATARSSKRAKEIGLRKVVGATRGKIIFQFMSDSMLMSVVAAILAALLVMLLIPIFNDLTNTSLEFNILDPANVVLLLATAIITGMIAGSYPALFLSSFSPIGVLRAAGSGNRGSALFRKILVVFQFVISIVLIIATTVIVRQLHYMQKKDLGIRTENVIYVNMEGKSRDNYEAMKTELLRNPSIVAVTRAGQLPFQLGSNGGGYDWQDRDVTNDVLIGFAISGYDYDKVLDLQFTDGRYYSRSYATDTSNGIIINESAVRIMNMKDPVGKWIQRGNFRYNIIGVMKDFHFLPMTFEISPLAMYFGPVEHTGLMMVRFRDEDPGSALAYVEKTWQSINPTFPFNFDFLDKEYQEMYESEDRLGRIFSYFAALAILISCLGLFGLASFMAEQRTREIGIRKTFGAPVTAIVMLMSKEFARLVLLANVIAIPLAWYALREWLSNYSYTTRLGPDIFILAFIVSIAIAWITVSYQAIKAALMNPVEAIKYE